MTVKRANLELNSLPDVDVRDDLDVILSYNEYDNDFCAKLALSPVITSRIFSYLRLKIIPLHGLQLTKNVPIL